MIRLNCKPACPRSVEIPNFNATGDEMEAAQSDAVVFFGASGDLAFKQIFPALLGLVGDEGVNVPIVGVAKTGWKVDDLRARAKASVESHGPVDAAKLARLLGLMRYVDGDYND